MNITKEQYARIEKYFPVQRGNVKIDNYTFINAILYIAENGCKWRALPEKYGKWNSIYQRFRTCPHRVNVRIFRHNFVGGKAKIRRRAVALQGFLTQSPAKFDEKTCMNP